MQLSSFSVSAVCGKEMNMNEVLDESVVSPSLCLCDGRFASGCPTRILRNAWGFVEGTESHTYQQLLAAAVRYLLVSPSAPSLRTEITGKEETKFTIAHHPTPATTPRRLTMYSQYTCIYILYSLIPLMTLSFPLLW